MPIIIKYLLTRLWDEISPKSKDTHFVKTKRVPFYFARVLLLIHRNRENPKTHFIRFEDLAAIPLPTEGKALKLFAPRGASPTDKRCVPDAPAGRAHDVLVRAGSCRRPNRYQPRKIKRDKTPLRFLLLFATFSFKKKKLIETGGKIHFVRILPSPSHSRVPPRPRGEARAKTTLV